MKHDWELANATLEQVCKHGFDPMRTCRRCGVVQRKRDVQHWGRVIAYRWEPLVDRCKGKNTDTGGKAR